MALLGLVTIGCLLKGLPILNCLLGLLVGFEGRIQLSLKVLPSRSKNSYIVFSFS